MHWEDIPEKCRHELAEVLRGRRLDDMTTSISYSDHIGRSEEIRVIPLGLHFGSLNQDSIPQWLLRVYNVDKRYVSELCLGQIRGYESYSKAS